MKKKSAAPVAAFESKSACDDLFDSVTKWRLTRTLYGELDGKELFRFVMLGAAFFFVIGGYWLLRPLKDGVFFAIVGGREYQPRAKMLSVIVVVVVAVGYGRAVTALSRRALFTAVCLFFAGAFACLSFFLGHPTIGLPNEEASPDRLIGWISYFTIETYGSLVVSMFWSYVSSTTSAASAGRGFSIVIGFGNVGAIIGPLLAVNAESLGVRLLFMVGAASTLLVLSLILSFDSSESAKRRNVDALEQEARQKEQQELLLAHHEPKASVEATSAVGAAPTLSTGDEQSARHISSMEMEESNTTQDLIELSTSSRSMKSAGLESGSSSSTSSSSSSASTAPSSSSSSSSSSSGSSSSSTPSSSDESKAGTARPRAGFFDGLTLLLTRPYLSGIFLCSTLYEVIATITDYQMKVLAHQSLERSNSAGAAGLSAYLGLFGMVTNGVALLLSLLGTSFFMRRFGLRVCLLAYPASVALTSLAMIYFASVWEAPDLLSVTFVVMVLTKGLSYALNNPAKEMMYIPTSNTIKYKAKSWVDLFGMRMAKAGGSMITNSLKTIDSAGGMMQTGAAISLGIVGVWSVAAHYVGLKFQSLVLHDRTLH